MALEGNVSTPLGAVPKKYLAVGGVLLALAIGIGYYRSKKSQSAANAAQGIDPATGFPYGSLEDQNALAAQGSSLPTQAAGGSGTPSLNGSGVGFATNAEWAQSTEQLMQNDGLISDPTALSAALGAYITGSPIADDTEHSLISQAIAFGGYPPIAGPNGFPPAINTQPKVTPPPPTTRKQKSTGNRQQTTTEFIKGTGLTVSQLISLNPQYNFPKGIIHPHTTLFIS